MRRSTVVDEVCRCHARPAERSGLLARSPREIISTCWSHPSTASAPTSHDVHEGGWTSERLWSIRCTGRLCSHCGWQSDPARSTASQRATLTGRVAPESPMLTVRASLSVCRCHGPVIWTALRGHVACSARSSAWPACTGAHILGSSSHVYLVFEEVTSGSEWGVLLRSPTHSNASSPMHDGKFLFKNM